jgi:NADPH:quinone reductase-like Zn-dependent oxidoreductase
VYGVEDFVEVLRALTSGRGVDVVLDMVGGDYVARNLEILATEGRLVQIAFLHGARVELNLATIMQRRLIVTGSTLRPRSVEEKGAIARALLERVWPLLEQGRIRPVIDRTFPLVEAAAAHRYLESGEHIGKVLLVN